MAQEKRVIRCELDEHYLNVLDRAKRHGYPKFVDAVRAGLRLLDKDLPLDEGSLSPCAPGTSLKYQLENRDCLRGEICKQNV